MTELRQEIIDYFNEVGLERIKTAVTMAECEFFREYMMQNFHWFKSRPDDFQLGGDHHKSETTWYRYYRDNAQLPKKLDPRKLFNNTLTEQEVIDIMLEIYEDYKSKGYDLLNSKGPADYNYKIPTDL